MSTATARPHLTNDAPFFAMRISDNIAETAEGYLICRNVPIARTGVQDYLGQEIGDSSKYDQLVKVHRLPQDVFDKATLASFEGKPITDDHPMAQAVAADNYTAYAKGHAQNVRHDGQYIIADLVIHDPALIQKIRNGQKREVSAGYNCEYRPYRDGYKQCAIRANHIAVVGAGRAGKAVAIRDHKPPTKGATRMNKQTALATMFAAYAKDASPEQVAEMLPFLTEDKAPVTSDADTSKSVEKQEIGLLAKLFAGLSPAPAAADAETKAEPKTALDKRLEAIEASQAKILKALDEAHKEPDGDETLDEEVEKILSEDEDPDEETETKDAEPDGDEDESKTTEDDDATEELKKEAEDAAFKQLIRDMKPIIAMLPKKQRDMVKDSLVRMGRRSSTSGTYAAIKKTTVQDTKAAKTSVAAVAGAEDLGRKWAEQHNPHYKKA